MRRIVDTEEVRSFDSELAASGAVGAVIDQVGYYVARRVELILGGSLYGKRVMVICGPGNNGADGRRVSFHLRRAGARVSEIDYKGGGRVSIEADSGVDLVVDAIFGTGLSRDFRAPNIAASVPVVSVDIASGLDADTGNVLGEAVTAVETVVVGAIKPGHIQNDGPTYSGRLSICLPDLYVGRPSSKCLVSAEDLTEHLARRPIDDHKWRRAVMVIAGSDNFEGAAKLVCESAFAAGAGMVVLHTEAKALLSQSSQYVTSPIDRVWARPLLEDLGRFQSCVIGPGLGRSLQVANMVKRFVAGSDKPTVIDADAIAAFGTVAQLRSAVEGKPGVIITPHVGEFNRLGASEGISVGAGTDRFGAVLQMAAKAGCTVLLKGTPTLISSPQGDVSAVVEGGSLLSFAGSGDVLSGVMAALLALGLSTMEAAAFAACVHGRASKLTNNGYSIRPEQLISAIPLLLDHLVPNFNTSNAATSIIESDQFTADCPVQPPKSKSGRRLWRH